VLVKLRAIW